MKYGYIFVRAFAPLINFATDIVNIFIWRDKRVVLFGAWMGDKYADNTRFLFQYLQDNKERYDIKKMVWVTRNQEVIRLLNEKGYKAYEMHSINSIYYHFKAGIHVVCNINFPVKGYAGDIMGQFSGHAIKINTWHGIPLKAGKTTGENAKKRGVSGKIKYALRKSTLVTSLFTPGHWDKAYYLSTGVECTRRCSAFCGIKESQFIEAGYPRDCGIVSLLEDERLIISQFDFYKKIFLYVPTFRETSQVPHPLSEKTLRDFLIENHVLWVEKPHAAMGDSLMPVDKDDNVLYLNSRFDINVLLDKVDLIITDYSSVCYDAMAYDKPVLFYSPDVDYYARMERGFLCNYLEAVSGFMTTTIDGLIEQLGLFLNDDAFKQNMTRKIPLVKSKLLDKQSKTCGEILSIISERTGGFRYNT